MAEKSAHLLAAEKVVKKMPKAIRDGVTLEPGGGEYTLLRYGGRTVASVRPKNLRITVGHDGSAEQLGGLASAVATAAESRSALKSKEERQAEREAKAEAREEAKAQKRAEREAAKKAKEDAKAAAEAEAKAEAAAGDTEDDE